MPDELPPVVPPAGAAGSTPAPGGPPIPPSEPPAGDEPISLDEARKLRSEAQSLRKRLKAFEDEEAKRTQAQMSETERLQQQLAEVQSAQEDYVAQIISNEVSLQAAQMNFRADRLDKVALLFDWDALEIDDNGTPTNVKELLEKLGKEMPELLQGQGRSASTGGGSTNPSRSATTHVGEITPANVGQYMQRYNELNEAQRAQVVNALLNKRGR